MMQRKISSFSIFSVLPRMKIAEKTVQDIAFADIKVNYVAGIPEYQSVEIAIDCHKRFHFFVNMCTFHIL